MIRQKIVTQTHTQKVEKTSFSFPHFLFLQKKAFQCEKNEVKPRDCEKKNKTKFENEIFII